MGLVSIPEDEPWKDRLHAAALELGMQTTADAIEHSAITDLENGELLFVTHDDYRVYEEKIC